MSKYYKAENVQTLINSLKCYGIPEINLDGLPTIETSEDCIERDLIISQLLNLMSVKKEHYEGMDKALKLIEHAPSVVLSRAEGEWIFKKQTSDYHITGQCSNCKERSRINNYCPWCGAKMKG